MLSAFEESKEIKMSQRLSLPEEIFFSHSKSSWKQIKPTGSPDSDHIRIGDGVLVRESNVSICLNAVV